MQQLAPRIAVIDGNPDVLRALRRLLDVHYTVDCYGSAVAGLRRSAPDALLIDTHVEDLPWSELLVRLPKGVPVLALSESPDELERELSLDAGCADYLVKPLADPDLLLAAVETCLDGGRAGLLDSEALRLRMPDGRLVEVPVELPLQLELRWPGDRHRRAPPAVRITLDLDHLGRWLLRRLRGTLAEGTTIELTFAGAGSSD